MMRTVLNIVHTPPNYLFSNGFLSHSFPLSLPLLSHNLPPLPLPSLKLSLASHSKSSSTPSLVSTMDSSSTTSATHSDELAYDLSPIMKVYKNGRIQRLAGEDVAPPGIDLITGVQSKDVVVSQDDGVSARIFLPKLADPDQKLPPLVYFHGGGFCIETPFSQNYHSYLNALTSQANVIGVSVHYRRAPEHPVPTAHEDSWTAMKWVASHSAGNGPDEWLNRHADLGKLFLAGDSAGGNLAHHMAIRIGLEKPPGVKLEGISLVHPYFWGAERIGCELKDAEAAVKADQLWRFTCPTTSGSDDPLLNPEKDPNMEKLDCKRVLVCVAENDLLKDRGWYYREVLQRKGFSGDVEVMETKEEGHVFHIYKPSCENAITNIPFYPSNHRGITTQHSNNLSLPAWTSPFVHVIIVGQINGQTTEL